MLAQALIAAAEPTGITGLYIMVYLATTLFTATVTNNAAVTIMFPVAYEAALDAKVRLRQLHTCPCLGRCPIMTLRPMFHTLSNLGGLYAVSLPADDGRQRQFYDAYRVPDEPYGVRPRRMYVVLLNRLGLDCVVVLFFPHRTEHWPTSFLAASFPQIHSWTTPASAAACKWSSAS